MKCHAAVSDLAAAPSGPSMSIVIAAPNDAHGISFASGDQRGLGA
jgi:hypothetical protein